MTIALFLFLLAAFSTITSLVVEVIKKLISDKANYSTNILVLVVAVVVGLAGTGLYYQLMGIAFTLNNIIYMFLMGLASAVTSMTSYDKVKQTILQLTQK